MDAAEKGLWTCGSLPALMDVLDGAVSDDVERLRDDVAEREARYRAIVDVLTEGLVLQGATGEIIACNVAAETILGLTKDQMMGRTSLDPRWRAIHPDGSTFEGDHHPSMVTLRTGEAQTAIPMGVHKPDGSLRWISINTRPLVRPGEDHPYAVVSSFTDVTDYQHVQDELQRRTQQLELALSSARAGVWEWNIETNEVSWSDQVASMFGFRPGTTVGTFDAYLDLVHPEDLPRVRERLEPLAAGDEDARYEIEHRIVTKNDGVRWIFGAGSVVDAVGKPKRLTGVVLDITHFKDLEHRVGYLQKMESVGRLAGGVAHDFNNVLAAILGGAELALSTDGLDEELQEVLVDIRDAAHQGARITRQLLSFARKQVLALEQMRVGESVRACETILTRLLGGAVTCEIDCQDTSTVRADPGQLEQVIVNLAVNAREAMPSGGQLRITTEEVELDETHRQDHPLAHTGRHVRLSVRDSGVGIAPADIDKLFEPFFTTKKEGTGLGLATTHGIVMQIGGHIVVSSQLGEGTTFDVYLPCLDDDPAKPSDVAEDASGGTETILVVDDEPSVLRQTVRALEHMGYQVLPASSSEVAMAVASNFEEEIHLLVSDVMMPNMNGVELAERLTTYRPGLRVLMTSGYAEPRLIEGKTLELLQKPFTPAQLWKRVRSVLD